MTEELRKRLDDIEKKLERIEGKIGACQLSLFLIMAIIIVLLFITMPKP